MDRVTSEQVKKFIKYVRGLSFFYAVKGGPEPVDPDIVAVMEWLEGMAEEVE